MTIGPHTLSNRVILAPMAGITDQPFRDLCVELGAGLAVAEMMTCNTELWDSDKNRARLVRSSNDGPEVVQIAGSDPQMMADAARLHVDLGADIIDINMGCPAKKVLKKAAGSALLKDTQLVAAILDAVISAVEVPVTLKIRTGWCPESRNGVEVARIAEDAGVQMLTVHGRTRECRFMGDVEYDTIAAIKNTVGIPVIANGDITSPERARHVLDYTGADGVMIGRAAQGNPWIFRQIDHYLNTGEYLPASPLQEVRQVLLKHMTQLHELYGDFRGVLFARKHVGWYTEHIEAASGFKALFNRLESPEQQVRTVQDYFDALMNNTTNKYFGINWKEAAV
ncbi:MAG: tRNA dihydrouridine synthase DusB [Gammaproteobacteria bacterium RIFCSPLOWO2_02_FULL_57_10]|nr:MAG: tRNA dihydrouridine synthase DusB [Gammaproteobacteria bacterium RIFCSPLOWO2_02_FULL_57_10]